MIDVEVHNAVPPVDTTTRSANVSSTRANGTPRVVDGLVQVLDHERDAALGAEIGDALERVARFQPHRRRSRLRRASPAGRLRRGRFREDLDWRRSGACRPRRDCRAVASSSSAPSSSASRPRTYPVIEENVAADLSSVARSCARQFRMLTGKPSSVSRRSRHAIGLCQPKRLCARGQTTDSVMIRSGTLGVQLSALAPAHAGGGGGGAALPVAAAIVLRLAIVAPSCIVSTAVLGTMTIVALSRFRPS